GFHDTQNFTRSDFIAYIYKQWFIRTRSAVESTNHWRLNGNEVRLLSGRCICSRSSRWRRNRSWSCSRLRRSYWARNGCRYIGRLLICFYRNFKVFLFEGDFVHTRLGNEFYKV